jgi:hypothetical protein
MRCHHPDSKMFNIKNCNRLILVVTLRTGQKKNSETDVCKPITIVNTRIIPKNLDENISRDVL